MPLENVTLVLLSELSSALIKYIHKVSTNYFWCWVLKVVLGFMCVYFWLGSLKCVSLHSNVLLTWLSSPGSGLWLYSDIQKAEKVIIGTVYLMPSLRRRGAIPPLPHTCFRVPYRDNVTFLLFYGNGQWVNHYAPSITVQAVETINYGRVLTVQLCWYNAQAATEGSDFGSRQGYGIFL